MPSEPTKTTEVETPTTQSSTGVVTDHDKDHDKDHDLFSYTEESHPSSIPSAAIASSIHTSSMLIVIITILFML